MEPYKNAELPVEERILDLLGRMTLEEKVAQMDMIRGVELATKVHEAHFCAIDNKSDFYWDKVEKSIGKRGIGFVHDVYSVPGNLNRLQRYMVEETRLGIPCIFTGEALHGLSYPGATIFPMPINRAATFHPELIHKAGHAIASETRSLGIHEILAPNLDLAREPRWGRVEETFGEDTYLASQMAYAMITGEQGKDIRAMDSVVAEPKHYCVHGIPEAGTNCSPARAGIREIETAYLPVFEAGIKKAGAYNAMASYNCIDGEAVICSEHYLKEILKKRFELRGYVRADFGAVNRLKNTHHMSRDNKESIEMAVNGGLDVQGFDFPNEVWQKSLIELVQEGRIKQKVIDEACYRILRVKFELGLFENPYADEAEYKQIIRSNEHRQISYQTAQESIVLLKNKEKLLPLSKEISSIAVIGPSSAKQRMGSYASVPYGYEIKSVYQEIKKAVGKKCVVRQADGCGVTEHDVELIPKSWYVDGILMKYYENNTFYGEPVGVERVEMINFNWILSKPHRNLEYTGYSVHMSGRFKVNTYDFFDSEQFLGKLVFTTQDSVRIKVDGNYVIESYGENKQKFPCCEFVFENGAEHDFEIEYVCDVSGNDITFSLDYREDGIKKAVEIAKNSEIVVLVCGDNNVTSGEGMDRCDLKLYGKQRELIHEVAKLNKKMILVLENGKPVDLTCEEECVDSILVAWFGGEFGAKAITDVLFGKISPSGKLPVSFPKSVGNLPCYYSMLPGGNLFYLEGEKKERFEFGFGLSYTDFAYKKMSIEKQEKPYCYTVKATIQNIGEYAADEIVQLYVEDIHSSIVTPDKLLKGFRRISLLPKEEKEVKFSLNFDSFKLMNRKMEWVIEAGDFKIMLGSSSRDIRLTECITI